MKFHRIGATALGIFMSCLISASIYAIESGYDNTFKLAVAQKFAIPEYVKNGDYVDYWRKTFTWTSSGQITYAIEKNHKNAFSVNSATGLITVTDATKINGKIIQRDTTIVLIIRTTDSKEGSELDSAIIRVKENAYCVFIDGKYTGTYKGTITQPFKTFTGIPLKPGFGYFIKRGTVLVQPKTTISTHVATLKNPTIFGAYGAGNKPVLNGNGNSGNTGCFFIGNSTSESAGRAEHLYFYSLHIRNYKYYAFKIQRISGFLGWYNCDIRNTELSPQESSIVISTSNYTDSVAYRPSEFINCVMDTTGSSFIKVGVGPCKVENCSFKTSLNPTGFIDGGACVRFTTGRNHRLKHCVIDKYVMNGVQERGDFAVIEDIRVTNGGKFGIKLDVNDLPHGPDKVKINNVYVDKTSEIAIRIFSATSGFRMLYGNSITNSMLTNGLEGIRIKSANLATISNNFIKNFPSGGIILDDQYGIGKVSNVKILNNVLCGSSILAPRSRLITIFNNTVNGDINLNGATNETVKNNICKSVASATVAGNNIMMKDINLDAHFVNYKVSDYRLKSTANSAINKGVFVGLNYDYLGNAILGDPDIGAYELFIAQSSTPIPDPTVNTAPEILDQQFIIRQKEFKDRYLGTVAAYDDDPDQSLTYSIVSGNESGIFTLDSTSGELGTTSSDLFTTEMTTYDLLLSVRDNGTDSKSKAAHIKVIFIGQSSTVHIDPGNPEDELESGTLSHPYDSWSDVLWEEGNVYLQKSGTTANVDKIVIGADNVSLGSYGEGDLPVITSNTNTYLISGYDKQGINIHNLHLISSEAVSSIYFLGSTCDNIVIDHCTLEGISNAIRIMDGQKFVIKYNTIFCENEGILSSGNITEVFYNVFKNNLVGINVTSTSSKANIFNNVFVGNGESVNSSYGELTLFNNIFYLEKPDQKAIKHLSDQFISNHNIFYPEQDGFIEIAGKTYSSLSQLQQDINVDMNSLTSDPEFTDLYHNKFTVEGNSPAINAGKELNLTQDFQGVQVPVAGVTDIGIFEFTGPQNEKALGKWVMSLYPNPTTGQVNILAENGQESMEDSAIEWMDLNVTDIAGKSLYTTRIARNGSIFQDAIDLSGISNGLYLIVAKMADKVIQEKLILNK